MAARRTAPAALLALAAVQVMAAADARAQALPSADAVLREQERQRQKLESKLTPARSQDAATQSAAAQDQDAAQSQSGGAKFKLKAVTFDSSAFLSPEELQLIASDYTGRQVDVGDLHRIVAAVNKLYAEKGILTALATLPPQKVSGGIVHVALTEGRLGEMKVTGANLTAQDFILNRVALQSGAVIDSRELSRQVILFNRTHDAQIKALLQPGSDFGLSDVQLAVIEPAVNTLQMWADNQGVESTGEYQFGGIYRRYGLLGIDDRLTVYATNARETLNGNVSYNLPLNAWGTRAGISYARGSMVIIDGPIKDLGVEGTSQSASLNLTHPLFVDHAWLIQGSLSGSYGRSSTTFSDVEVTETDTGKVTTGLSFSYAGEGFAATVSPAVSYVDSHSLITREHESPFLFTGTASVEVAFADRLRFLGNASWQLSSLEHLPGDQLFQIGGPTTVRGYPANAVSGDEGYLINAELHREIGGLVGMLDLFVFLDRGVVYSSYPDRVSATSAGLGVNWTICPEVTLELIGAHPFTELVPDQRAYEIYGRIIVRPPI